MAFRVMSSNRQANSIDGGTCETYFIQGGNRAPSVMRALDEGPIIGLMVGYKAIRRLDCGSTCVDLTFREIGVPCCWAL